MHDDICFNHQQSHTGEITLLTTETEWEQLTLIIQINHSGSKLEQTELRRKASSWRMTYYSAIHQGAVKICVVQQQQTALSKTWVTFSATLVATVSQIVHNDIKLKCTWLVFVLLLLCVRRLVCVFQVFPWTSRHCRRCLACVCVSGRRRVCRASWGPVMPLCVSCRSSTRCATYWSPGHLQRECDWHVCTFWHAWFVVIIRINSLTYFKHVLSWIRGNNTEILNFWGKAVLWLAVRKDADAGAAAVTLQWPS